MRKPEKINLLVLVLGVILGGILLFPDVTLYVDEVVHYQVIKDFCHLRPKISPHLVNIPAYHGVMALLCYLGSLITPLDSLPIIRGLSLALNLAGLWIVYQTAQKLDHKRPGLKALQVFFLPVAYVFYFLVYTDISALMLVVLGFYLTLEKKYQWAGLAAILSVVFRQNNIVWLGWLALLGYWQEFGLKISLKNSWQYLKQAWVHVLGVLLFALFVYLNGGISLAKAEEWAHPAFSLYIGNIYLMLVYFSVVFFPELVTLFKQGLKSLKNGWWWKAAVLVGLLGLYFLRFENTHPYNQHPFALHNLILLKMDQGGLVMLAALFLIILAVLLLSIRKLKRKEYYLVYLFSVFFVVFSWLIEPRYYIVPFSLYLLVRQEQKAKEEWLLLGWQVLLSIGLLLGTSAKLFFP